MNDKTDKVKIKELKAANKELRKTIKELKKSIPYKNVINWRDVATMVDNRY